MTLALIRVPASTIIQCELTYLAREPIDFTRAQQQHRAYCAALARCGARVVTLPARAEFPDSVFVEDTAIIFAECAVITAPGALSRRAEAELSAAELARYRPLARIASPATIDGGDVLRIGKKVFVGLSQRTNPAGIDALRAIIAPFGYEVSAVPVRGCLHLKTGCTALDGHTLLANPDWIDLAPLREFEIVNIARAEPFAANVLRIGATILAHLFPATIRLIEQRGYAVFPIDISEFIKAEAGLTCMSLLIENLE